MKTVTEKKIEAKYRTPAQMENRALELGGTWFCDECRVVGKGAVPKDCPACAIAKTPAKPPAAKAKAKPALKAKPAAAPNVTKKVKAKEPEKPPPEVATTGK